MKYCLGVDVGSGSVRAGLFSIAGESKGVSSRKIRIRKPETDFVEQSSSDIWENLCLAVKDVVGQSGVCIEDIVSVGFDATCSLVVVDNEDNPVSVNKDNDDQWNIIMWMDHRAMKEAEDINAAGHDVLKYVGGKMSPEMQIPKILWLKKNCRNHYDRAAQFFDLADFLQYKSTGVDIRSSCTLACKWTYLAHENRWDKSFFEELGLQDLLDENESGRNRIGNHVQAPGTRAGGLTKEAAAQLGLSVNTSVSIGLIDAHAGGVGSLVETAVDSLVIVAGTSACHMLNNEVPVFIPGVWGPYYNAMIPDLWLNEGGQSAYGSLLDYVLRNHSFYAEITKGAFSDRSVFTVLNEQVKKLSKKAPDIIKDVHVLDYHHGNRSPHAYPKPRGMIVGLDMSENLESLAKIYWATIQSICFGTKHIMDNARGHGYNIDSVIVCGGVVKNSLYLQELANICGCDISIAGQDEAVLFGSALMSTIAAGIYPDYKTALKKMAKKGDVIRPLKHTGKYYRRKYEVYLKMFNDQLSYEHIMD